MKIQIDESQPAGFAPINVNLTIESERELGDLLNRLFASACFVRQSGRYDESAEPNDNASALWDALDTIAIKRQLFGLSSINHS